MLSGFFTAVLDPAALGFPVGDRRDEAAAGLHVLVDAGVVGDFHLVDGDAVGGQLEGLGDVDLPVVLGFLEHAGDEVDVDLLEPFGADAFVGAVNFLGAMSAAVDLQDAVVEGLDPEGQAGDADVLDRGELAGVEGAGLALEGDLLGGVPGEQRLHLVGEVDQLGGGKIGRGAAAEVDEVGPAAGDERLAGHHFQLADRAVEVVLDLIRVLVGVDAEIAEVAALPAEGDVVVEAERGRGAGVRGGIGFLDRGGVLLGPERKGRVVRDEIVAGPGGVRRGRSGGGVGHDGKGVRGRGDEDGKKRTTREALSHTRKAIGELAPDLMSGKGRAGGFHRELRWNGNERRGC